jgi:putative ABC transport system substrate-binding protein
VTPFVDRRAFIGTLTGGLLTAPLAAEAQPARRLPQLCVLTYDSGTARSPSPRFAAFFQGPQDLGYLSERTIAIQYLSADGRNERFSELVAECLRLKPDIIVVTTTPAAQTAKTATSTVPIVMVALGDLQGTGLVDSLARPGGHVTDMSQLTSGLAAKRLALLKEPVPRMSRVLVLTFLVDPIAPLQVKALKEVAPSLGVSLLVHDIRFNTTLFNRRL